MKDKLVYNSIITYNYLQYLKSNYPHIDHATILKEAGIEPREIYPGHWFSQETVNRFNQVIVKATKNKNISREVGRFAAISWPENFLREIALTYISPSNLYDQLGNMVQLYCRNMWVTSRKQSKNRFEVCLYFKDGEKPEKYQCENFTGYLEAITFAYRKKFPIIEHNECIFDGAGRCRYIITISRSFAQILASIKFGFLALSVPTLYFSYKFNYNVLLCLSALIIVFLSIWLCAERLEKKEVLNTFAQQKLKPSDYYKGYYKYYEVTNKVREASYSLSRTTSVTVVIQRLSEIYHKFNHHAGIIGIVNNENNRPIFNAPYVFEKNNQEFIELSSEMTAPSSSFLFSPELRKTTFREVSYYNKFFPPWLYNLCLNYEKIIFTPILAEQSLLGYIILEHDSNKDLHASDIYLIDAIASQAALSLINIFHFTSLLSADLAKKDFLSVAAHELLTPIQIANSAIHYLKLKSTHELAPTINTLNQALLKLDSLGKNIINLSTHYDMLSSLEYVDFKALLLQIKDEVEILKSKYHHNFKIIVQTDIKSVKCNKKMFSEAIMNLIQNAAKYTPGEGTIELNVSLKSPELIFSVKDDGIGIPKRFQKKIFLRFFQVEPNIDGCGIGLFYCSDVIKKHGGYITVNSPVNPHHPKRRGTEFVIHLPLNLIGMTV